MSAVSAWIQKIVSVLTPNVREKFVRDAQILRDAGQLKEAAEAFERAGMSDEAGRCALKAGDYATAARLHFAGGKFELARRCHLAQMHYDAAGRCSLLMGDYLTSRSIFSLAAREARESGDHLGRALLHEYAGELREAAQLYEQAHDFEAAAECYDISFDYSSAGRCGEKLRAFSQAQNYSKRVGTTEPAKLRIQAGAASKSGSFIEAAKLFRAAGDFLDAGMCFEKVGEWERAARAYDAAGLHDRANLARMRAADEGGKTASSNRGNGSFVSPTGIRPVLLNRAKPETIDPATKTTSEVAPVSIVKPGSADPVAVQTKDERDSNGTRESLTPEPLTASHSDNGPSSPCGAFIHLAFGRKQEAIEILLEGLHGEQATACFELLFEVLSRDGRFEQALEVLSVAIPREAINAENAPMVYRAGCLLQTYGAFPQTLEVFEELLAAGASNPELQESIGKLRRKLDYTGSDSRERSKTSGDRPSPTDLLMAELRHALPSKAAKRSQPDSRTGAQIISAPFLFEIPADLLISGSDQTGPLHSIDSRFNLSLVFSSETMSRFAKREGSRIVSDSFVPEVFWLPQRYRVQREIRRDAISTTYAAFDMGTARLVDLIMLEDSPRHTEALAAFIEKACALAKLSHRCIAQVVDVGYMDFRHYWSREPLYGPSVEDFVRNQGGERDELMKLIGGIAAGTACLHANGIYHGHLTMQNVRVGSSGGAMITGFGLRELYCGTASIDQAEALPQGILNDAKMVQEIGLAMLSQIRSDSLEPLLRVPPQTVAEAAIVLNKIAAIALPTHESDSRLLCIKPADVKSAKRGNFQSAAGQ